MVLSDTSKKKKRGLERLIKRVWNQYFVFSVFTLVFLDSLQFLFSTLHVITFLVNKTTLASSAAVKNLNGLVRDWVIWRHECVDLDKKINKKTLREDLSLYV